MYLRCMLVVLDNHFSDAWTESHKRILIVTFTLNHSCPALKHPKPGYRSNFESKEPCNLLLRYLFHLPVAQVGCEALRSNTMKIVKVQFILKVTRSKTSPCFYTDCRSTETTNEHRGKTYAHASTSAFPVCTCCLVVRLLWNSSRRWKSEGPQIQKRYVYNNLLQLLVLEMSVGPSVYEMLRSGRHYWLVSLLSVRCLSILFSL